MNARLKGKKTYIVAIAAGVVVVARGLGFVDDAVMQVALGLLGFTGLATLRHGISNK